MNLNLSLTLLDVKLVSLVLFLTDGHARRKKREKEEARWELTGRHKVLSTLLNALILKIFFLFFHIYFKHINIVKDWSKCLISKCV